MLRSFHLLDRECQLRLSAKLVDEILQARQYSDGHVIMFDRRKYVRESEPDNEYESVINH